MIRIKETIERGNDLLTANIVPAEALNIKYTIELRDGVCLLHASNQSSVFLPITFQPGERFTISLKTD